MLRERLSEVLEIAHVIVDIDNAELLGFREGAEVGNVCVLESLPRSRSAGETMLELLSKMNEALGGVWTGGYARFADVLDLERY